MPIEQQWIKLTALQNGLTEQNVILTGPPRSGTTLTCFLLNKLPETVALNEPMSRHHFRSARSSLEEIEATFEAMRKSLLEMGTAKARQLDGSIPDNPFESLKGRPRNSLVRYGEVRFEKMLSEDFLLLIKQCPAFTFLLPYLQDRYPCYAVVRNPLAILASWNSIATPISQGRLLVLETLSPLVEKRLSRMSDVLDRQIYLLSWFFEHYLTLPQDKILRYEKSISSGGKSLSLVTPFASHLAEPLRNRNQNPLYDFSRMKVAGEKLLASQGAFWEFYSPSCVEKLLSEISRWD